jgi:alpha-galactosidase
MQPVHDSSTGIEADPFAPAGLHSQDSGANLVLSGRHFRLTAVTLQDGSDLFNELISEREWLLHPNETLRLQGNLFCIESLERDEQTLLILEEPLPHARPVKRDVDLTVTLDRVADLHVRMAPGPWTRLDCAGGPLERARALQAWQRSRRPDTLNHQLPSFLSNTWGDRSRDGRMNHAFIVGEIDSAARLGVDVVQLDDGWQKGVTSNSINAAQGGVWEGFWNADPAFWQPHPERFPQGLEPLVALAAEKGVALGLWFAPDSWNDFVHWEKDAETVLGFYRNLGVRNVKIDGIKAHSEIALERLRGFVDRVLEGSGGEVVFDLDITAETRPGYFGMMFCGPLFVENRYTDWASYWPHFTLRTLWKLSRWIDPLRLRLELLNPERNPDKYANDPLGPIAYRGDALFASVMCANPLGWFEVTGLSDAAFESVRGMVSVWKKHRAAMAAGTLLPIGPCPDGFNFSGFLIVPQAGETGMYVLLFRGNTLEDSARIKWPVPVSGPWETLAGEGALVVEGDQVTVTIPEQRRFLFAKVVGDVPSVARNVPPSR